MSLEIKFQILQEFFLHYGIVCLHIQIFNRTSATSAKHYLLCIIRKLFI